MNLAIPLVLSLCLVAAASASPAPQDPISVGVVLGAEVALVAWTPYAAGPTDEVEYQVHGHNGAGWVLIEADLSAVLSALVPAGYADYGVSVSVNGGPMSAVFSNCLSVRLDEPSRPGVGFRPECYIPSTLLLDGQGL